MLLKYSQYQRRSKLGANGKPHRGSVTGSRIPNKGKAYRKGKIVSSKKLNGHKASYVAKREEEVNPMITEDPTCDNSNDSGLGFDQVDYQPQHSISFNNNQYWSEEARGIKRPRVDIKLESDNANDNFTFPQTVTVQQPQRIFVDKARKTEVQAKGKIGGVKINGGKAGRSVGKRGCADANNGSIAKSRDGTVCLEIISQPESQHRARYQTEGSRGAVKDTTGNSFPLVKLTGYGGSEAVVLQVYIGTDQGKVAPHMFYQACKVSGKNSTPCVEQKLDGTVVIQIEFDPSKDNLVLCDCVGILKERNVDVEHRFPEEATARSRKKSTRCRMVFKTVVTLASGQTEVLQVTSHPIACTQPPGVPEICKKSLSSCPVTGNTELFIIGKNFLKDTKVKFSEGDSTAQDFWECVVQPDKEFLHQSHLVCFIPRYKCEDIKEAVYVNVSVVSGGKSSEPVTFSYTPVGTFPSQHTALLPTSSPTSTSPTTSFFAVTQNLGSANQTILQGVPERTAFTSPQKILIIPSTVDLSSSSVASASLSSDDKGLLKTEGGVWMKEELGVVPVSSLSSVQTTSLVQTPTSRESILLGVSPVSAIVQTTPSSSSPTLLQESTINQSPTLIGVTQPSTILQVSEMVHSGGVVAGAGAPAVLQSPPGVLHSPELSPVALPTSPVLQNPAVGPPILEQSPVLDTLSQASSLIQTLVPQANMVPSPTLTSADLIQNPPSQTLVSAPSIVPNLSHGHIVSQSMESSQMVQNSPTLDKSPGLVLSPNMTHPQSSPSDLSPPATIVHSSSVLDSPNLNPNSILPDQRLNNPPVIPKGTIAETAALMQNPSMMDASSMVPNSLVTVGLLGSSLSETAIRSSSNILVPAIGETSIRASNSILGPAMAESTITSTNIMETTTMLQENGRNTSVVRGLESTTPGGAANAVADLNSGQLPSMATIEKFVSRTPLPTLSVETYLSHIENKPKVDCSQNLMPTFPDPQRQESPPIALKQMVVAAATLEPKPTEAAISFAGNNMNTINREVMHHNPVLLSSTENQVSPPHLNFQNQEFLQTQATNFQLIQRPEAPAQAFAAPQFSGDPIFESPPLYSATASGQEKHEAPKPPPATQYSAGTMFETPPLFTAPPPPQEKHDPTKSLPSVTPSTKKCEEGIPVPHELTVMSENDLISYINPSCFDQV